MDLGSNLTNVAYFYQLCAHRLLFLRFIALISIFLSLSYHSSSLCLYEVLTLHRWILAALIGRFLIPLIVSWTFIRILLLFHVIRLSRLSSFELFCLSSFSLSQLCFEFSLLGQHISMLIKFLHNYQLQVK